MGARSTWARGRRLAVIAVVAITAGTITATAAPAGAATGWKIPPTPNPTGAKQTYLDGLSCTGPTTVGCFAVGSYVSGPGPVRTLIERWNGSSWKIVASPNRAGAITNALVAVSCASSASCFAVGNSQATTSSPAVTLIEHWNGVAWTIAPSPNASRATGNFLRSISCVGPLRCIAAGNYTSASTAGSTLIERWNGKAWSLTPSPNRNGAAINVLSGVSCTATVTSMVCFAVGSWSGQPDGSVFFTLTERFNGTSWVVIPSPNVGGKYRSTLNAVSCTSVSNCLAVGVWQHNPGASLSEHWNGSAWTIVNVTNPVGYSFSQLNSVSCPSPTSCIAVGSWSAGSSPTATLIAHFNGAAWTIIASPNPASSQGATLAAVSCVAAKCTAAGSYQHSGQGSLTLAERNF